MHIEAKGACQITWSYRWLGLDVGAGSSVRIAGAFNCWTVFPVLILNLLLHLVIFRGWWGMFVTVHVEARGQVEDVSSLHLHPRHHIHAPWLAGKCPYMLSHPSGLRHSFWFACLLGDRVLLCSPSWPAVHGSISLLHAGNKGEHRHASTKHSYI